MICTILLPINMGYNFRYSQLLSPLPPPWPVAQLNSMLVALYITHISRVYFKAHITYLTVKFNNEI